MLPSTASDPTRCITLNSHCTALGHYATLYCIGSDSLYYTKLTLHCTGTASLCYPLLHRIRLAVLH